jgi:hypothetical protein
MVDETIATFDPLPKWMNDHRTTLRIQLSIQQAVRLRRAAAKRDMRPNKLLTQIVATVLDHDIIDAVLDDE